MRAYIAAPFFNPVQIERVEFIKSVLESQDIEYFSPKDHCVVGDINSKVERNECFNKNIFEIECADFVIAVTDGKGGDNYTPDSGTVWESGYAFSLNKPIIYFAETLGDKQFNLMLAESGVKVCLTRAELEAIDFENVYDLIEEYNNYEGSIE